MHYILLGNLLYIINYIKYLTLEYTFKFIIQFRYKDPGLFLEVKSILMDIGYFFQVQDDFLDVFGDPALTGKIGTDIQNGKCTWFAVKCMQKATDNQKQIMRNFYGSHDSENVEKIKGLYHDLDLLNVYKRYENESYDSIKMRIQNLRYDVPQDFFSRILDKSYQRNR